MFLWISASRAESICPKRAEPVRVVVQQPVEPSALERRVDPRRVGREEPLPQQPLGQLQLVDDVVGESGRQLRRAPALHLDTFDAERALSDRTSRMSHRRAGVSAWPLVHAKNLRVGVHGDHDAVGKLPAPVQMRHHGGEAGSLYRQRRIA